MKRIFVSQRVDIITDYNERRDALDQRWTEFLRETSAFPLLMPNDPEYVSYALKTYPPDGILLTGGNSPINYGGNAPERDTTDTLLIKHAVTNKIPLLGVCRGMQSVILHFGGTLTKVTGHISIRHKLTGEMGGEVNSYHGLAAKSLPPCLEITAFSEDGSIEAICHTSLPIWAVMWHPERENPYSKSDIALIKNIWYGGIV